VGRDECGYDKGNLSRTSPALARDEEGSGKAVMGLRLARTNRRGPGTRLDVTV